MITEQSVVSVVESHLSCELDGEAVILNLEDGVYYGLNSVGARVWSMIQQPRQVSDIIDTLTGAYEVERGRCRDEVIALLENLAGKGLIHTQNGSST